MDLKKLALYGGLILLGVVLAPTLHNLPLLNKLPSI